MTRTWVGRTAVRAYPAEVRAVRGDELIGTLLDAGEHSVAQFARHLVSLVTGGLAARARAALAQPLRPMGADVLRWACIMIVARGLTGELASLRWDGAPPWSLQTICLLWGGPALVLVLFTAGRDRMAALVGLMCLVADILSRSRPPVSLSVQLWLPEVAGFIVMVVAPRRKVGFERALWLIPAVVWALFWYTELGRLSGVGYVTPVLATLVVLPIAPAFALGTAAAWSLLSAWYLSIPYGPSIRLGFELLSCAPLAVVLLILSRRALRRT
jgi:hypothetical protein